MKEINFKIQFILTVAIIVIVAIPLSSIYPYDPTLTYVWHIELAKKMAEDYTILSPHFLYQALVICVHYLAPFISFEIVGYYVVPLFTSAFLGIVVYQYISSEVKQLSSSYYDWVIAGASLVLLFVTPISFLTYPRLYLGYIGITVYHSATTLLAKPLSLLIFIGVVKVLKGSYSEPPKNILYLIVFTILSTLAKPSYIISLLPIVLVIIFYKFFIRDYAVCIPLILGLVAPSILVLAWQYIFTYQNEQTLILGGESSIIFAPLQVMSYFSKSRYTEFSIDGFVPPNPQEMKCQIFGIIYSCDLLKDFFLSILFPLSVYIMYFNEAKKNIQLNICWLVFSMSVFYVYFLAESGGRMYAGNFLWSGQLTLFVLFVVSTGFLLKKQDCQPINKEKSKQNNQNSWYFNRFLTCVLLLGVHAFSGLVYLVFVTKTTWL